MSKYDNIKILDDDFDKIISDIYGTGEYINLTNYGHDLLCKLDKDYINNEVKSLLKDQNRKIDIFFKRCEDNTLRIRKEIRDKVDNLSLIETLINANSYDCRLSGEELLEILEYSIQNNINNEDLIKFEYGCFSGLKTLKELKKK